MRINNQKGVALAISLLIILVLITLSAVFVLRTINEQNAAKREVRLAKAFYIAEAGINDALDTLDEFINTDILAKVNSSNPQLIVSNAQTYVASGEGVDFLIFAAEKSGVPHFTKVGAEARHDAGTSNFGDGSYDFEIIVTEKLDPFLSGPDTWDFPYYYRVEAGGTSNTVNNDVLLSGDFTIRVQRDNFAKYALFTNQQTLPSGTNVWFTDKTNFAGPIHTNKRFNIALQPSGTFEGLASQVEQTARFYNSGSPVLLDADTNPGNDVPTWNSGFNRGVPNISLSSAVQQQDMIDQARAGDTTTGNGIFLANNGTDLTGGIYVDGDSTIDISIDASSRAVYSVVQGGTTKTVTVDKLADQTLVDNGSTTTTYNGLPDGVDNLGTLIYVNGNVTSVGGNVHHATEATIASQGNIKINDHIRYENYTSAVGTPGQPGYVPPNANGHTNLLGLVSWNGDVNITTSAPNDIDIHASILVQNGKFQVDSYNDTGVGGRGTATLMGGVISDFYGAFGLFNGSTGQQVAGYGRNFVYDERMQVGKAPPYFPSLNTFIAFTNDLTDKLIWQEGG